MEVLVATAIFATIMAIVLARRNSDLRHEVAYERGEKERYRRMWDQAVRVPEPIAVPPVPLTELRQLLGDDGTLPPARFDREGGFQPETSHVGLPNADR